MTIPPALLRLAARLAPYTARYVTPKSLLLAIAVVFMLNITLYATCGLRGCPDPERLIAYQPGGASELLDRRARKFGDLAPVQREVVKLSTLPAHVGQAFVAVEDRRFYRHRGVDWRRVFGAALVNIRTASAAQGSSTITMQLSRNIFSEKLRADDKSFRRKLFEARVARQIERRFGKQEILELYLNHIYFGGGAYGVQAAARYYFDKPAKELSINQAALLAALPKAPALYDPRVHPERARSRRNLVIDLMAAQGFIDAETAERARSRRLAVTAEPDRFNHRQLGAYFAQLVRSQLERKFGERIYREKLRVYTTLDVNAQRAAEEELRRQLRAVEAGQFGVYRGQRYSQYQAWSATGPAYAQGAAVIMETHTGDILALVGGREFAHSQFNRATRARRQAGSAFKPFVFAAALDDGYVPSQTIMDAPYRLVNDGTTWEPRNYDGQFYGIVSMRDALVYSRNIPSVRLAAAVGAEKVAAFARAAGIPGPIKDNPMVALGVNEVTPLQLTRAYASLAGLGRRAEPRLIRRVETLSGEVLWEIEPRFETTVRPAVTFVITDMLADAVDYGTGSGVRAVGFRGPVAGKTGTTSDGADVWFAGYTPDLVGVVWLGFDQRKALPARATGGTVAAPVFGRILRRIYARRPMPEGWVIPESIVARDVDPATGLILEDGCVPDQGEPRREIFLLEDLPATTCPRRGYGDGRNLLDHLWSALSDLFEESAQPVPQQGPPDQNLGTPRVTPVRRQ